MSEIEAEGYRLWNFQILKSLVTFNVAPVGRDAKEEDVKKVMAILDDLGKWENLVKTGLHLFSELKIGNIQQADLQDYEKPFGKEQYQIALKQVDENIEVAIRLTVDERHIREQKNVDPIFSVPEIYNQINNISKWKAFEKTLLDIGVKK
jgi:hypothetical protein